MPKLHWNWHWYPHTQSLSCDGIKKIVRCSSSSVFQSGLHVWSLPFLSSKVFPVLLMLLRSQATINVETCKSLSDLVVGCLISCLLGGCLDGAFIFSQPERLPGLPAHVLGMLGMLLPGKFVKVALKKKWHKYHWKNTLNPKRFQHTWVRNDKKSYIKTSRQGRRHTNT